MARILYISQGYSAHDRRFLGQLRESGHAVWFLPCARNRFTYEERPLPAGVEFLPPLLTGPVSGPLRDAVVAVPRLRGLVRRIQPDWVQAGPVQSGAFFAALAGCQPLLVMSWGSDILVTPNRSAWLGWVTRFTLGRARLALADCRVVRERIGELSGLSPKRIVTLPYGVELERYNGSPLDLRIRERLGWNGCRVLISVRSLEARHGAWVLLKALRQVLPQVPDLRVLMLGEGTLRPKVERALQAEGLRERVHWAGQIREDLLPGYLREADLYVSASFSDGTSVSLLEAMASGLPVLVTDEPGNREWVEPGVHGWLTPAGDASALAEALMQGLALSPTGRQRMAKENRRRVQQRADWRRNFEQLTQAYRRYLPRIPRTHGELIHA